MKCDGRLSSGAPLHTVEDGTLHDGLLLRTMGWGPDRRRFSVSRELASNGVMFRALRHPPDGSDEQAVDEYYERVPDQIRCGDVTEVDFKNLTFGSHGLVFSFHAGIAQLFTWEGLALAADGKTAPKPDFQAEIGLDKTVSPAPGVKVRFLRFELDHLTGSGWANWVVGFTCAAGTLREVFARHALSLRLESLTDDEVTVSMLPYSGKNTAKWWRYRWSKAVSRYQLDHVWLTPRRPVDEKK